MTVLDPAPVPVEPVGHEEHSWVADSDGLSSRAQVRAGSGSYRSTTPARLADLVLTLPGDLSADVDEATAALGRLDSHASSTLGPQSAELGPMSSILLRTESASSSQIENLTVGARQLALAEIDQGGSTNARTVVANVRAMEAALDLADSLDQQAILTMHDVLLSGQRGAEHHAGQYRSTLVWVGKSGISPLGAEHVAPQADLVEPAMADLMTFVDRDDLPALVQTALAHAQLETIHPFADGNGRTGRALIHAMLRAKGVTRTVTAPVSAGLLTDTRAYFDALTAFRDGDARPIIEQLARASRYAASTGTRLVDDLSAEIAASGVLLGTLRPQAAAWRLLPHLVAHPVVDAQLVGTLLATNPVTAQRALAQLTDAGILHERTGLRRNRVWQHDGVLAVLDLFAQRIRRG